MPAPITAPTPSAVNWNGPSVLFRLCSPASLASSSNKLIGFFANKGLPMQLLLCEIDLPATVSSQIGLAHCSSAPGCPYNKFFMRCRAFFCLAATTASKQAVPTIQSQDSTRLSLFCKTTKQSKSPTQPRGTRAAQLDSRTPCRDAPRQAASLAGQKRSRSSARKTSAQQTRRSPADCCKDSRRSPLRQRPRGASASKSAPRSRHTGRPTRFPVRPCYSVFRSRERKAGLWPLHKPHVTRLELDRCCIQTWTQRLRPPSSTRQQVQKWHSEQP